MSKINNNTMLALVSADDHEVKEILAEGSADIKELLAAGVVGRAEPQYGMEASHVTNTTRKYQCNAALAYVEPIKRLRKKMDLGTDGAAIRLIMEAGLRSLGFGQIVDEVAAELEASTEAE